MSLNGTLMFKQLAELLTLDDLWVALPALEWPFYNGLPILRNDTILATEEGNERWLR